MHTVQTKNEISQAQLSTKFDYIHGILSGVLALIPSGPSFMLPIIAENFPHKMEDVQCHVWYVKNVLRILKYAPVLRNQTWSLLVDRTIQIDVSVLLLLLLLFCFFYLLVEFNIFY